MFSSLKDFVSDSNNYIARRIAEIYDVGIFGSKQLYFEVKFAAKYLFIDEIY
jgi:hypothetical protein